MDEIRRLLLMGIPLAVPTTVFAAPVRERGHGLSVSGAVPQHLELSVEALRTAAPAAPLAPIMLTDAKGAAKRSLRGYRGVRVTEILDAAGIDALDRSARKRTIAVVRANDGYTAVFSLGELYNSPIGAGAFVLVERNGEALAARDGPLALVSAKDIHTGPRHVRGLRSIELQSV